MPPWSGMARGLGVALVGISIQLAVIAMVLVLSDATSAGPGAFAFSLLGVALVSGGVALEFSDFKADKRK